MTCAAESLGPPPSIGRMQWERANAKSSNVSSQKCEAHGVGTSYFASSFRPQAVHGDPMGSKGAQ
jgi:hypothetical protein